MVSKKEDFEPLELRGSTEDHASEDYIGVNVRGFYFCASFCKKHPLYPYNAVQILTSKDKNKIAFRFNSECLNSNLKISARDTNYYHSSYNKKYINLLEDLNIQTGRYKYEVSNLRNGHQIFIISLIQKKETDNEKSNPKTTPARAAKTVQRRKAKKF